MRRSCLIYPEITFATSFLRNTSTRANYFWVMNTSLNLKEDPQKPKPYVKRVTIWCSIINSFSFKTCTRLKQHEY